MKLFQKYLHWWALAGLIICATVILFYQFGTIPAHLAFDELEFARLAFSLEKTGYTVYSQLATGHATLYFYILLASLKTIGTSVIALRLPAALFALGSVVLYFFILRKTDKRLWVPIVATFVLLSLRWFFTFGRFSFEATFLLCLELGATYATWLFIEKKKPALLVAAAVLSALAFHSYIPGRLFFLVPLLFIFLKTKKIYSIWFLGIFLAVASPLLVYLSTHQDIRVAQVSLFSNNELSFATKLGEFGTNIQKLVLMFINQGDMNGRHNFPGKSAINPLLIIFFGVGLVRGLVKRNDWYVQYFLVYLVVAAFPSLVTVSVENPNMLRTFTMIPAIIFFVTMGLDTFFHIPLRVPYKPYLVAAAIGLVVLTSAAYDLRTYFMFQYRVSLNAFEITCPLKEALKLKGKTLAEIPLSCRVSKNMF